MKQETLFLSDDLSFVATIILLDKGISIERVTFHPNKPNVKVFYLSPKDRVENLFRQYVGDQLQVSPQRLSTKIAAIRHLPAEGEPNGGNYGNY